MVFLTPEQTATRLQLSLKNINHYLRTGQLPGKKIGRFWRISEEALEAFMQSPSSFLEKEADER